MVGVSAKPLSTLSVPSIPKTTAKSQQSAANIIKVSSSANCCTSYGVAYTKSSTINGCNSRKGIRRLNAAGLADYEPDLNEDPVDRWDNTGISDAASMDHGCNIIQKESCLMLHIVSPIPSKSAHRNAPKTWSISLHSPNPMKQAHRSSQNPLYNDDPHRHI
ncbi:hypothetical protein Tco_0654863 [Tanacetum coccineum]|uniref:Uncharacterized protein n=1 Tax=Tanacetum coccineum TaxID=301880 RepID=A0ABQ4X4D9_9ASTR